MDNDDDTSLPAYDPGTCPRYSTMSGAHVGRDCYSADNYSFLNNDLAGKIKKPYRSKDQCYRYAYDLRLGRLAFQLIITVRPLEYPSVVFDLSIKTNKLEHTAGQRVRLLLTAAPDKLDFTVCALPGPGTQPPDSIYHLRVWLKLNGIEHGLFAVDHLGIGRDIQFSLLPGANFARLKVINRDEQRQIYLGMVGKARVEFVVSWRQAGVKKYEYTINYQAGGVGNNLFMDLPLFLDCDPTFVSFLIFTTPHDANPLDQAHKLQVWMRTLILPFDEPFVTVSHPPCPHASTPTYTGNDNKNYESNYSGLLAIPLSSTPSPQQEQYGTLTPYQLPSHWQPQVLPPPPHRGVRPLPNPQSNIRPTQSQPRLRDVRNNSYDQSSHGYNRSVDHRSASGHANDHSHRTDHSLDSGLAQLSQDSYIYHRVYVKHRFTVLPKLDLQNREGEATFASLAGEVTMVRD